MTLQIKDPSLVRERFVRFLRSIPDFMRAEIEERKRVGILNRERNDFVWYHLITSLATQGNSRGYANLMADARSIERLRFDSLGKLPPSERLAAIEETFRSAKIRMAASKARNLAANYDIIAGKLGGIDSANKQAFAQSDMFLKKAFFMQFKGIGEKYGRNIWMDVYDVDFRSSIALDVRLEKVVSLLGIDGLSYEDKEEYLQEIAVEAGVEPWELDRLCYHFTSDVLSALSQP